MEADRAVDGARPESGGRQAGHVGREIDANEEAFGLERGPRRRECCAPAEPDLEHAASGTNVECARHEAVPVAVEEVQRMHHRVGHAPAGMGEPLGDFFTDATDRVARRVRHS